MKRALLLLQVAEAAVKAEVEKAKETAQYGLAMRDAILPALLKVLATAPARMHVNMDRAA